VLVSFGTDEQTKYVIDNIQADGTCWCSATAWRGRSAMRISVSSAKTTEQDIEKSVECMLKLAKTNIGMLV
jgi:hypothetical protein